MLGERTAERIKISLGSAFPLPEEPTTEIPPELAADVMDKGIVLTGGGAMLRGLDERLKHETSMPIHVPDDPLHSVVFGSGKCIEEFESLKKVLVASEAH